MEVGLGYRAKSAILLYVEGLENGALHAGVPALVVAPAGPVAAGGECEGVGDALLEVELPAAEGLDALAPGQVTPVAVASASKCSLGLE
jgi:hypothetical protein